VLLAYQARHLYHGWQHGKCERLEKGVGLGDDGLLAHGCTRAARLCYRYKAIAEPLSFALLRAVRSHDWCLELVWAVWCVDVAREELEARDAVRQRWSMRTPVRGARVRAGGWKRHMTTIWARLSSPYRA